MGTAPGLPRTARKAAQPAGWRESDRPSARLDEFGTIAAVSEIDGQLSHTVLDGG
jgi:hypothetical protein